MFFSEPPQVGDQLEFSTRIEQVYRKTGSRGADMPFLFSVTEFRDPKKRVAAEYLGGAGRLRRMSNRDIQPRPELQAFGPVTRTDFVRYQGASGDMQSIHHDEQVARRPGLPRLLSPGVSQAGVLGTWLAHCFGALNVRRYRMRFTQRVWPGDVLTCDGEIVVVRALDQGQEADIELTCTRQTSEVVVRARATCIVRGM